jgi:pyruvate dehydrogenase (quinone)
MEIDRAVDLLNAAERVVILARTGARAARNELLSIADVLAAPIVKALLGKSVVPDENPFTTGGIRLLGRPSQEAPL